MRYSFASGTSISEYILPIALVGLTCIGAFTLLGNTASSFLNDMGQQMDSGKSIQLASNSTDKANNVAPTETSATEISSISNQINLSDISTPYLPTDTSRSIDTTGANGTTEILATQLSTFIQQSLVKGDITEAQANQLQGLANQGFRLGEIEAAVENAFANNQNSINFEGKTYSLYELAHTLNAYAEDDRTTLTPTNNKSSLSDDNIGSELHSFIVTYNEAKSSGALTNTEVKTKVTGLASQISTISDNMAESIFRLTQTDEKSSVSKLVGNDERNGFLKDMTSGLFNTFYSIDTKNSSTTTTTASNDICSAGNLNNGQSKKNGCS